MFLGPTDRWPTHSRPLARAALEEARAAGWYFGPSTRGHSFGRLRCLLPEDDLDGDACWVAVFSTSGSADGSDTARVIHDAMRKCRHQITTTAKARFDSPEAAASLAWGKAVRLDQLLEAADGLIEQAAFENAASEIMETAILRLNQDMAADTDELDEQLGELEDRAASEGGRAYAAACRAGTHDPWPPSEGACTLVRLANDVLREVVDLVSAAIGSEDEAKLLAERARLQIHLDRISTRLENLG
jgi:hypothetical protein